MNEIEMDNQIDVFDKMLKPCPFCGGEAKTAIVAASSALCCVVQCDKCHVEKRVFVKHKDCPPTFSEALCSMCSVIDKWNQRGGEDNGQVSEE